MSSDQSGQEYVLASPSLVSPHSVGDGRGQRGASLLPCIASLHSKSALRHAGRSSQVLSLFKSGEASDCAESVYRYGCLGSSLFLHLAIPLLCFPCDSLYPTCFWFVMCLSLCTFATFFMSFCPPSSDVATVDFLQSYWLPYSSSYVFVSSIPSSRTPSFSVPTAYKLLSSTIVVAFGFWYLLIQTSHPQASDACYRDKAKAASLDDSIQSFPRFTTRMPLSIMAKTTSHTIMSKKLGRVDCSRGSSFPCTFHCQVHGHTHSWNAVFWDASKLG